LDIPLWAQVLKDGEAPLAEPHFPSRLFLFVWRNWELANTPRMAAVLQTSQKIVLRLGAWLGLPPKPTLSEDQLRRIYITVIRQNWHILPHEQLIALLGWDRERYEFTLKEDDFLWSKLGLGYKPRCEKLIYRPPSPEHEKRAAEIRRTLRKVFGHPLSGKGEPPFQFVKDLSRTELLPLRKTRNVPGPNEIDLADFSLAPSPEPEVQDLAQQWINYLAGTFGTKVRPGADGARPFIQFQVRPELIPEPESFEIQSGREGLRVVASDQSGLRQAVYHLQDLVDERQGALLPAGTWRRSRRIQPRYIYPYFALYGDPLADLSIDPFPAGYLEKLGRKGVNGVWIQAVLRNLAPSPMFPEFGQTWETRLANLRQFVQRAKGYGLKIYLYINEPRAMPAKFFERHPEVRGTPYVFSADPPQEFAVCTSVPKVRDWLRDSLAHVFSQVPGLGGLFTITASENLTNCFAHGRAQFCPRCAQRQGWEVVTELLQTFADGVHKSNPEAEVIAWDWGWGWVKDGPDPDKAISHLPRGVRLLSVSEWGKEYTRGGVPLAVAEYSMSVVGPGANAIKHWAVARQNKIPTLAKVQVNNTWEISAVPYIPVPNLIQQHMENLLQEGVAGLMLSWTLGGYPSPNLEVAKEYFYSPAPGKREVLERVAIRRYGPAAVSHALAAWECFSRAFQEFPYGVVAPYSIPTQHGPSNLLRLKPTGYRAAMILFPYDDLKHWLGPYSPKTARNQFEKMADQWKPGLDHFRRAVSCVSPERAAQAAKDLGIAETCYIHFRSVANQIRWYDLRDQLASGAQTRTELIREMKEIAGSEIELSKRLYVITRRDSTIGYEASNHYYYRPLDLAEKVLNCSQALQALDAEGRG
jgi:hypothetical protein